MLSVFGMSSCPPTSLQFDYMFSKSFPLRLFFAVVFILYGLFVCWTRNPVNMNCVVLGISALVLGGANPHPLNPYIKSTDHWFPR